MARQKGVIKLEGRIGDLSFYKSGGEYMARTKGGVDAERIKTDPAYARTRENGAEFGRAGKAGKLLRSAFKVPISRSADKRVASRLAAEVLKVIQADSTNLRGERIVSAGDLSLLGGFEFNAAIGLDAVVGLQYNVAFDRTGGIGSVALGAFVPAVEIAEVEGATHFQFVVATAGINFDDETYEVNMDQSAHIPYSAESQSAVLMEADVSADSTLPVFMLFGVEYFQSVNGQMYPLNNKESNPLALVLVDTP